MELAPQTPAEVVAAPLPVAAAEPLEELNLIEFAPLDSLALLELVPAEHKPVAAADVIAEPSAAVTELEEQLAAAESEIAELNLRLAGQAEEIADLKRSLRQQAMAVPAPDTARMESLEAELQAALADKLELETRLQSAQQSQPASGPQAARIRELEAQVTELTSVVQEFLEQQSGGGEEGESLQAELETVRAQANSDVMSLQTKLRAEEQEVSRLRRELDGTYAQVLQLQTGFHVGGRRKPSWRGRAVSFAIGLALVMCGMLLALFLFKTTDLGTSLGMVTGTAESTWLQPMEAKTTRSV
jgi:regulator of replication initiation timing